MNIYNAVVFGLLLVGSISCKSRHQVGDSSAKDIELNLRDSAQVRVMCEGLGLTVKGVIKVYDPGGAWTNKAMSWYGGSMFIDGKVSGPNYRGEIAEYTFDNFRLFADETQKSNACTGMFWIFDKTDPSLTSQTCQMDFYGRNLNINLGPSYKRDAFNHSATQIRLDIANCKFIDN